MAIDLGSLTGIQEVKANLGYDKIRALADEILALDTDLRGYEDPEMRDQHDEILAYTIRQFLLRSMRKGFVQWLKDAVEMKRDLRRRIDDRDNALAESQTGSDLAEDLEDVNGITDGF